MHQKNYGSVIEAIPPIQSISANKLCVVFRDRRNLKRVNFKNSLEKHAFISWLIKI